MKWFKRALVGLGLAPLGALADGVTVDTAVTSAITSLESGASAYAAVILPYIVNVGVAFIGITVVYLLFKVFKRFVGGR